MALPNAKFTCSKSTLSALSTCIALALSSSAMAAEASFTVTRSADDEDPGSLRSAINAANAQPGADVITFADGLGPIVLNGTDLPITESLSIIGPSARQVISGNQLSGILRTNSFDIELVLENLRLIDGQSDGSGSAINVQGPLTVRNSILSGNSTTTSFDPGGAIAVSVFNERSPALIEDSLFENNRTLGDNSAGGAIFTRGTLTIRNSTFRNNQTQAASSPGGAISASGDFFEMFDSVVEGSTVSGNNGGGGGISATTVDGLVVNSIVRDNAAAAASGGGIRMASPASGGVFELVDSTISGNRAGNRAGGVYTLDMAVSVVNSTISGNLASGTAGPGALFVVREPLRIENSTIVANVGGNIGSAVVSLQDTGRLHTVTSSIISANAPDDSEGVFSELGTLDITASVIDVNTQINGVDLDNLRAQTANLGPLADNGCNQPAGFPAQAVCVPTHALLGGNWPGSNPGALTFDQRGAGFPRQVGDVVDAGSVEQALDLLFSNSFEILARPE